MGPVGWVRTPTLYIPPLNTGVVNEKDMAPAGTVVSLPPLFCSTRPVPVRPVIMPVTLNELVAHTTEPGTSAPPTIAGAAGVTAQVWLGLINNNNTVIWGGGARGAGGGGGGGRGAAAGAGAAPRGGAGPA